MIVGLALAMREDAAPSANRGGADTKRAAARFVLTMLENSRQTTALNDFSVCQSEKTLDIHACTPK